MKAEEERPQADEGPHATSHGRPGQLLAGVAWAVLLLGLWLWGRDLADGVAAPLTTTGDVAAVGRPLGRQAPPHAHAHAHAPVPDPAAVRPSRLRIGAPVMSDVAIRWYARGPQPGEAGTALLNLRGGSGGGNYVIGGRDDATGGREELTDGQEELTDGREGLTGGREGLTGARRPSLSGLAPGQWVDVVRSDGSTLRFTVEDVQLHDRAHFDARTAHAAHDPGRSELRLTGEAPDGRNVVVVSAYLTGYQPAGALRH
ncbi:class F sortase [Streptomyces endophytica]|uniref:Class F sortase n=1 Tax=Streptomyces endophytica TaxID=2991496 RepID=A0ABY6PCZ7_9ACTN|nr:class F sortase [Streptomyces endophytica]UZJ31240.1 class F sortase [Streptomyces endophytica]